MELDLDLQRLQCLVSEPLQQKILCHCVITSEDCLLLLGVSERVDQGGAAVEHAVPFIWFAVGRGHSVSVVRPYTLTALVVLVFLLFGACIIGMSLGEIPLPQGDA